MRNRQTSLKLNTKPSKTLKCTQGRGRGSDVNVQGGKGSEDVLSLFIVHVHVRPSPFPKEGWMLKVHTIGAEGGVFAESVFLGF